MEWTVKTAGGVNCARGLIARWRTSISILTAAIGLSGCSFDLLSVDTPDRVSASSVEGPASATLLARSVQAQVECAFNSYITGFALIGDELMETSGNGNNVALDRRDLTQSGAGAAYASGDCSGTTGLYTPVNTARWFADDVLAKLESWTDAQVPNRTSMIAQVAAYGGYSYVLLGEGFCSAAIDGGPELTRQQIFSLGEAKFTRAIAAAQAAGNTAILNMARVGRARTRLNLGDGAGAVADATLVPAGFVANFVPSDGVSLRENLIFVNNGRNRTLGVDPSFRGLTFEGVADRRVPTRFGATILAGLDFHYQDKYTTASTPIPIARYTEAQLIIAEVQGGSTAVSIINNLHAAAGLPAFSSTDPVAIAAQVQEERRRELFLESHRINDLIRFAVPFNPAVGTPYFFAGNYGSTRCAPLPDRERLNNNNIP